MKTLFIIFVCILAIPAARAGDEAHATKKPAGAGMERPQAQVRETVAELIRRARQWWQDKLEENELMKKLKKEALTIGLIHNMDPGFRDLAISARRSMQEDPIIDLLVKILTERQRQRAGNLDNNSVASLVTTVNGHEGREADLIFTKGTLESIKKLAKDIRDSIAAAATGGPGAENRFADILNVAATELFCETAVFENEKRETRSKAVQVLSKELLEKAREIITEELAKPQNRPTNQNLDYEYVYFLDGLYGSILRLDEHLNVGAKPSSTKQATALNLPYPKPFWPEWDRVQREGNSFDNTYMLSGGILSK